MLDLPEIVSGDFESELAAFLSHASLYDSSWNMMGEHSIGIVLAELFVFLKVTQQKNMNKITPESLMRICRLAGGELLPLTPSACVVYVKGSGKMPNGTKLVNSGVVFETAENISLADNKIARLCYLDGDTVNIYNYPTNGNSVSLFTKCDNFIVEFEKPVESGEEFRLYIAVEDNKRTPVTDKDGFADIIGRNNLKWQYFGIENDTLSWHDLEVIADGTLSLLFSGILTCRINGVHCLNEGYYPIKCILENDFYDIYPALNQVCLNAFNCLQADTKCVRVNFTYDEFSKDAMYVDHFLAQFEAFKLFINSELGFAYIDDPNIAKSIVYENNRLRLVLSNRKDMDEVFKNIKDISGEMHVVSLVLYESNDFAEYVSSGTSNMQFETKFANILPEKLSVMVGKPHGGDLYWEQWDYVPDLLYCAPDDKVFTYRDGMIITGDNKNGRIPYKSIDDNRKNIIISSLVLSDGESGNIPAGECECFAITAEPVEIQMTGDSCGGKNKERPEEMLSRILTNKPQGTLAAKDDFVKVALRTEGLIIEKAVCVLAVDENGGIEPNAVAVNIYLNKNINSVKRLEWYKKAVSNNLMKYKPLTLKMDIKLRQ